MERGEERGNLLFLALGSPMVTLGMVVPSQMKAGSLVRVSGAQGMNAGGSCGKGCQLPYLLIAWADGVIVAWR